MMSSSRRLTPRALLAPVLGLYLLVTPAPLGAAPLGATPGAKDQTVVTPPVAPPSPSLLWREVLDLIRDPRTILPGSHPNQPGSRTIDAHTTDFVNATARQAILHAGSVLYLRRYPAGSLLVKENFLRDGRESGVTAMLKLPGYDPADRNWVMASYSPAGRVIAYGKVASCIGCHAIVRRQDFVYAPPPTQLLPVSIIEAFFPGQKITALYRKLIAKHPHAVVR